jgi:hypothetical protein
MTRIPFSVIVIVAVVLAVFGGRAISAQDKYTVQVPNGLAFSEFRGYEDWQVVAVSQSGDLIEVIVAFRTPAHGDTRSSTMTHHPTRSRPKGPAWIADSRAIR